MEKALIYFIVPLFHNKTIEMDGEAMPQEKKSTYTGQTDARRKANAKYLKEAVEDVRIRVPDVYKRQHQHIVFNHFLHIRRQNHGDHQGQPFRHGNDDNRNRQGNGF